MANFVIGTVISIGASYLLNSVSGRSQTRTQTVEQNKQENFNRPRSSYGDYISRVWGWGRVSGILIYDLLPPIEEVSDSVTQESQSSGGKGGGRNTTTTITQERTYFYYGDCAWIISQPVTSSALQEIRLNGQLFWKNGQMDAKFSSRGCIMRFKEGTNTQNKDELLEEFTQDGHHNYRFRAIIVIERLPLEFFGGNSNYPQISVTLKNGEPKLSEIITDICLESPNLTVDDIDVSDLTNVDVYGYQIDSEMSLLEKINRLGQIYLFDVIDSGNKIKFRKQYRPSSVLSIPFKDLGTYVPGEDQPSGDEKSHIRYEQSHNNFADLPSQYEVQFLDRNNNLSPGIERSPIIRNHNQNIVTVDFSGVLTADEAQTIANQLLWLAWERSVTQSFTVPLRYAVLEPGDVVGLEIDGVNELVQIQEISLSISNLVLIKSWKYRGRAFNFAYTSPTQFTLTETATLDTPIPVGNIYSIDSVQSGGNQLVEGIDYTVDLESGTITPITGGSVNNGDELNIIGSGPDQPRDTPLLTPSNTILKVLDICRAYPGDARGIYLFGDGDENWRNASIYASRDNQNDYRFQGALVTRSVFGTCDTILGNHNDINVTDTTNTLDITVPSHAELASISTTEFERGDNRALVGAEIIDFQNATLLGTDAQGNRQYRLDTFKRGLSYTYDEIAGHGASEEFFLLSGYRLVVPGQVDDVGKTIYFKAVSLGQTLDDVTAVSLVVEGNGAKALQPTITDFSPTQGNPGTVVKIFGEGFSEVTAVTFGGVAAESFAVDSDTQITATIATETTTGKILLSDPQAQGESISEFVIGNVNWGNIGGTLANQTDLQTALNNKQSKRSVTTGTLNTDLQLTINDAYFQQWTPQVQNRSVILPANPASDPVTEFEILNLGNGSLSLNIKETVNGAIELSLNTSTKFRSVRVYYDGSQWVSNHVGYYE